MAIRSSATAPFRSYKMSDAQAYADGLQTGLTWRDADKWTPGGPWVCPISNHERQYGCPDWAAYCDATARHNGLWRKGWAEGNAQRLADAALANQLVTLIPA